MKSLTIVLKSLPNAKIPNKIRISISIDLGPMITVQGLNYIGQDRPPFSKGNYRKVSVQVRFCQFLWFLLHPAHLKIFKVPTIWFDNVNNIKFKQEKLTGSVFLGLLNAASSCPIIFCLHVR